MNKTFLVIKREYLTRVKKKSFLLTTILTPLIFPAILGAIIYFAVKEKDPAVKQVIEILDKSGQIQLDGSSRYNYVYVTTVDLESAKLAFQETDHKALLYIPPFDLDNPQGITIYSQSNISLSMLSDFEKGVEGKIETLKLEASGIDSATVANLRTNITIRSINLSKSGEEKASSAFVTFGIGYVTGIMIYMFIFIYGAQIMQGVIEEKNSRVVEVLISSVKPFQLMMGKVIGIAAVGLTQLFIWFVLITALSMAVLSYFGLSNPSDMAVNEIIQNIPESGMTAASNNPEIQNMIEVIYDIPYGFIIFTFIFYFIGGFLLYGALFAAVGSAVDSPSEAQQFIIPITIPIMIAFIGLFVFILEDPDSTISFWFSVIPFTSPIAMMGRVAFGIPVWQLIVSMLSLVAGFVFTIWFASRIYRVGILLHGTKVNYKVLAKWFLMNN